MSSEWMAVNLNKAGMDRVPKEKVNKIIYEMSKNSEFSKKEQKTEELYRRKGEEVKRAISTASRLQKIEHKNFMNTLLQQVLDKIVKILTKILPKLLRKILLKLSTKI